MAREFQILDAANWRTVNATQLKGGDVFRVMDTGVQQFKASNVPGDTGVYEVAQVSADGVHVPARVPVSGVEEVVIGFAEGT